MASHITFRPAKAADIDFIIEANCVINDISDPGKEAIGLKERIHADILHDNPKAYVIIAEMDGAAVGMAMYSFAYFANEGRVMWLSQVYVRQSARKHGVAFGICKALGKQAAKDGCYAILGGVGDGNVRAKRVYKFAGAKELGNYKLFCMKV